MKIQRVNAIPVKKLAREAVDQGFTAMKTDVDGFLSHGRAMNRSVTNYEIHRVEEIISAARDEIGPTIDFSLDCHWAFDVPSAVRIGRALEPYNLMWLEDPIPSDNIAALAKVTQELATPVCMGEVLSTRFAFREIFEKQATDIITPDLARA